MRIAAYNVENLFDRAKAFNSTDPDDHQEVLDAFSELNKLFETPTYTPATKGRMLDLIEQLGMGGNDNGKFTRIRKIRGRLIYRPRRKPRQIVANGRDDWIGWCELKTEAVDETAMLLTARVIFEVSADVLAVVEAESRPVLQKFQEQMTRKLNLPETYRHLMIIDGNDTRGIDVGLATRTGYPIGTVRSHVDDLNSKGAPLFSRDCPEYQVTTPSGQTVFVLPNHFKSKYGGNASSDARRKTQAERVVQIYNRLRSEGAQNIVVLGDFNDTPDSDPIQPLMQTCLRDVSDHPNFTEFEFRATGSRGIGTFGTGRDSLKIDYLMLSPALFDRVQRGGIFRKGVWTASNRWEMYPELTSAKHGASDHHLIWADIDI